MYINRGALCIQMLVHTLQPVKRQRIQRVWQGLLLGSLQKMFSHGWKPPQEYFQHTEEASVQFMRTVANIQPRAAKMPPVVREHKQIVEVRGSLVDLSQAPVGPMQRLKSVYTLPETCNSNFYVLPEGAQLLRTTPLRSMGCISASVGSDGLAEQAWGIPFTPDEFIQEARVRGHPKLFTQLVPSVLQQAILENCGSK